MPQNYALSVVKMGSFMFCICYYNTFFKILPIVSVSMSTHARTHTQGIWLIKSVAFSITLVFGQELGPKSRFLLLLSGTAEPARQWILEFRPTLAPPLPFLQHTPGFPSSARQGCPGPGTSKLIDSYPHWDFCNSSMLFLISAALSLCSDQD